MTDTVPVTIGGEVFNLPRVMNFATLERVWPAWDAMTKNIENDIAYTAAAIGFVSALLVPGKPDMTVPEIKTRLRVRPREADERPGLYAAVGQVLEASGFVPKGEAQPPPAAGQAAGTEQPLTGTTSTQN